MQRVQGPLHAVRAHLVGIANAWPQMGIGLDHSQETAVDGAHGSEPGPSGGIAPVSRHRTVGHRGQRPQLHLAVRQGVVAFFGAARGGVVLEGAVGLLEFSQRHPETTRTGIKMLGGGRVGVRIGHQGQVMGEIGALVIEASPFGGHGDAIREPHRVAIVPRSHCGCRRFQALLHGENGPGKGGRVATVKDNGIEAVQGEVGHKPGNAAFL